VAFFPSRASPEVAVVVDLVFVVVAVVGVDIRWMWGVLSMWLHVTFFFRVSASRVEGDARSP